jgi:hypothetical protein
MKKVVAILALVVCVGCAAVPQRTPKHADTHAQSKPVQSTSSNLEVGEVKGHQLSVTTMGGVEEGTFFFQNGYSTLILELKKGGFRYWFSSDVSGLDEPTYPVTGEYSIEGPRIKLMHKERHLQDEWTFRKLNSETTLWRPTAITWWRDKRAFDFFGVLYPTRLKPEEIWHKSVWKVHPWATGGQLDR